MEAIDFGSLGVFDAFSIPSIAHEGNIDLCVSTCLSPSVVSERAERGLERYKQQLGVDEMVLTYPGEPTSARYALECMVNKHILSRLRLRTQQAWWFQRRLGDGV